MRRFALFLFVGCSNGPDFSAAAIAKYPLGTGLPSGFFFGTATAAHQIEGDNDNDWTAWEHGTFPDGRPHIAGGRQSGVAAGSWTRWPDDIVALRSLGANAYRMSIEWSRLSPTRTAWNAAVISQYREQLTALRVAGIEPFVTVHHFTFPLWVAALGGWEWPSIVDELGNYCERLGQTFGDVIDEWLTVNEINAIVLMSYTVGGWPPGVKDNKRALEVYATLIEAHAACAQGLRRGDVYDADGDGQATHIGIPHDMEIYQAASASPVDAAVTGLTALLVNDAVPSALKTGIIDVGAPGILSVHREVPALKGTLDYLGINYYRRDFIRANLHTSLIADRFTPAGLPQSDNDWNIYPRGMYDVLKMAHEYGWPIVITENGVTDDDDDARAAYTRAHLYAMEMAIKDGVDVRGYFHWTLVDCFEWQDGFSKTGLFSLDADLNRVPKPSTEVFREAARGLGLVPTSP